MLRGRGSAYTLDLAVDDELTITAASKQAACPAFLRAAGHAFALASYLRERAKWQTSDRLIAVRARRTFCAFGRLLRISCCQLMGELIVVESKLAATNPCAFGSVKDTPNKLA